MKYDLRFWMCRDGKSNKGRSGRILRPQSVGGPLWQSLVFQNLINKKSDECGKSNLPLSDNCGKRNYNVFFSSTLNWLESMIPNKNQLASLQASLVQNRVSDRVTWVKCKDTSIGKNGESKKILASLKRGNLKRETI